MKNTKKIFIVIGLLLSIVLLIFICLFFNYPRVVYSYDSSNDSYYISKVYGNSSEYEIKSQINGKNVTYISERAFQYKTKLEKITLPSSITKIEKLAFSDCTSLKEINLKNVMLIERNAFSYCKALDNIEINGKIGGSAFYKCESLETVILLDSLISIGTYSFSYTKIKQLILPDNIKYVFTDAFIYASCLETIECPAILKDNGYLLSLENIKITWR